MQKFNVGDKIVEVSTGDEGEVIEIGYLGDLYVRWTTGECTGEKLYIDPFHCVLKADQTLTVESCIKFLTEQGYTVTLTKG